MIAIRCDKCHKYYALKWSKCPNCEAAKCRNYYIRLNGKYHKGGNLLETTKQIEARLKLEAKHANIKEYKKEVIPTFEEFLNNNFIPYAQSRNKRYQNVAAKIEYFRLHFGNLLLNDLSGEAIDIATNEMGQHRSLRTRDYYLAVIKQILNYAIRLKIINVSPIVTEPLNVDNSRLRFLSKEESRAVVYSGWYRMLLHAGKLSPLSKHLR